MQQNLHNTNTPSQPHEEQSQALPTIQESAPASAQANDAAIEAPALAAEQAQNKATSQTAVQSSTQAPTKAPIQPSIEAPALAATQAYIQAQKQSAAPRPLTITIAEICRPENLKEARDDVSRKHWKGGIDGMPPSELPEYWHNNQQAMLQQLLDGSYQPNIVQSFTITNRKGKSRVLSHFTTLDTFVQRAMLQVMSRCYEQQFSEYCFAYRQGRGMHAALKQYSQFCQQFKFVIKTDIQKCFDTIAHDRLLQRLRRDIQCPVTLQLLGRFLKCRVQTERSVIDKTVGLMQGAVLSPLLSNVYLSDLDQHLEKNNISFCRYGDDIVLFGTDRLQCQNHLALLTTFLTDKLALRVNPHKTSCTAAASGEVYLGYIITRSPDGSIDVRKFKKAREKHFNNWATEQMFQRGNDYHVLTDGVLSQRNYTVLFENEEISQTVPVETIEQLNVYSSIVFASGFFYFAAQNRLRVNMFDRYGQCIGAFLPLEGYKNSKIPLRQLEVYKDTDKRRRLAESLLNGAFFNMRTNLRYYNKRLNSDKLAKAIARITRAAEELAECADIQALMMKEAQVRNEYYSCFSIIIGNPDFKFTQRTVRPPRDAINSLISFGNTLMYQLLATEICKTPLDVRIGVLHAMGKREESLNLDVAEIFKPLLVDRTIFALINKQRLDVNLHFERRELHGHKQNAWSSGNNQQAAPQNAVSNAAVNTAPNTAANTAPSANKKADKQQIKEGVFLNREAKAVFVREFRDSLWRQITIGDKKHNWLHIMQIEIRKLLSSIETDQPYKPFKYY